MTTESKPLPLWIRIISGLIGVIEIGMSIMMFVQPDFLADKVDMGARGADYLIYMWAARQFALGCIFLVAVVENSRPMLVLCYIFLVIMLIGDVVAGAMAKG